MRVKNGDKDMPVRIDNVNKRYGKTRAMHQMSLGLDFGECFALLGVSGAGKTTTFKALTGVLKPESGRVTINGFDLTRKTQFN